MKRRGFLRALVGAAVAPIVAQAAPLLPTPAPAFTFPAPGEVVYSVTFKREPKFFDVVCYTGDGVRKEMPRGAFEPTLIIVKCRTKVSSWYVFSDATSELPPECNLPGHEYVAYEFGEEARAMVEPHLNSDAFIKV